MFFVEIYELIRLETVKNKNIDVYKRQILERMKNLTDKQKHSPIKSRRFYRRQMWLPALVLIASILLLWQNAGENSHSPRPINLSLIHI